MADRRYFVRVMEEIVESVSLEWETESPEPDRNHVYYIPGHPRDVARILIEKDESDTYKYQKYPLITLIQDFKERPGGDLYLYDLDFTLLILEETKQEWHSLDRYENVFEPILYPIYELLLTAMEDSFDLRTNGINSFRPEKIDRTYWGVEGVFGNDALIFNDYLDGIQLDFKKIQVNFNSCQGL